MLAPSARALEAGFARIRAEAGLRERWPDEALAEAVEAAVRGPAPAERRDMRHLPLVTIDPPASRDLDQAVHVARRGTGYRVRYAVADVASFVAPRGPLDAEVRLRATTVYLPDGPVPLHPGALGTGAASLLPGADRAALVWTLDLHPDGARAGVALERALVRSRRKLGYGEVQAALDAGTAPEPLALLREVGRLCQARERARGGVSLDVPVQEVVRAGRGFALRYEAPLPVEGWNAQVSLLAGRAAADLMAAAGAGVFRTMPAPDGRALARLARTARALGVAWPEGAAYADVVRGLDPRAPGAAAFLTQAARALRGAGYTAWRAAEGPPPAPHGAVAAPYAHVTAPLRRLADRFAGELALAAACGLPPPAWALDALPHLPGLMREGGRRARAAERAAVDYVEALVLAPRVGDRFAGAVVDAAGDQAVVQLADPAVVAAVPGAGLRLGEAVEVVLTAADPSTGRVRFAPA